MANRGRYSHFTNLVFAFLKASGGHFDSDYQTSREWVRLVGFFVRTIHRMEKEAETLRRLLGSYHSDPRRLDRDEA